MNALFKVAIAAAIGLSGASLASAQQPDHAAHHSPSGAVLQNVSATAADGQLSEGVVRKVDKDAQKITIRHGELKNLDMPPMTMVFRVNDPASLDKVKAGDNISFVAEQVGGQFTVSQIEVKQ